MWPSVSEPGKCANELTNCWVSTRSSHAQFQTRRPSVHVLVWRVSVRAPVCPPLFNSDVCQFFFCFYRHAADHQIFVIPACGAALSAIYSGVLSQLQQEGRLPPTLANVVAIVCGGSSTGPEKIEEWKWEYGLWFARGGGTPTFLKFKFTKFVCYFFPLRVPSLFIASCCDDNHIMWIFANCNVFLFINVRKIELGAHVKIGTCNVFI